jgi:hypothetical protein
LKSHGCLKIIMAASLHVTTGSKMCQKNESILGEGRILTLTQGRGLQAASGRERMG